MSTNVYNWAIGILITILFGIVSSDLYWVNRSVNALEQQVAVLNFTVLKVLPKAAAVESKKSDLLAVPLLPLAKFLEGNDASLSPHHR